MRFLQQAVYECPRGHSMTWTQNDPMPESAGRCYKCPREMRKVLDLEPLSVEQYLGEFCAVF
ncbi:MAG: hypothetical protein KGL39_22110 [Patescibacteria group bacterium]|nr:hypothetical protein [Patescibacteria group bacterium]